MIMAELGNVSEIVMGQAPKGDTYNKTGDGLPLIAGASDFGESFPNPSRFTSAPSKKSQKGDVILCIRATIGNLNWSDKEYCLGRGVAALRPKNGQIDTHYLWRVLEFSSIELESKGRGATFKQITKSDITDFEIPLPPLDEQKRIAAILDQADALRRLRQEALDKLNTLAQSIFYEMFGKFENPDHGYDEKTFLDTVLSAKIGLVRGGKYLGDSLPIEYLRMDAIGIDGGLDLDNLKRTKASDSDVQNFSIRPGDFLFNTRNSKELVGKTAVVRTQFTGVYNNNILRVRFNEYVTSDFVDAYFRTRYGRRELETRKSGTTSVFAVYQKALNTMPIPLPPKELQIEFSKRLNFIYDLQKKYIYGTQIYKTQFASLQQRAFRGEL